MELRIFPQHNRLVISTMADKFSAAMQASPSRGKINGVSSLVMIAAFLFANMLCVAPRLHEKIHKPSAAHECAVTLIAAGKYEGNNAPPLVPAPQSFVEFSSAVALPSVSIPALFLSASVFEHAPPVFSFSA